MTRRAALALLVLLCAPAAQGCARLSGDAPCHRFDSVTAGDLSAFACAPLGADALNASAYHLGGLRVVTERVCKDWDGSSAAECAHSTGVDWPDVVISLLCPGGGSSCAAPAWYTGHLAHARLALFGGTGADAEGNARSFPAPAGGREGQLATLAAEYPQALFFLLLQPETKLYPSALLQLLRTAERAMGTRQRYALGAASPTGELGAAALALSRPALHSLSGQRCDAWAACLRAARVPLLHCGHLVEDGAAYRRGAGAGDASLPAPLPGNPAAVGRGGPGSEALCTLPSTAGDAWCAGLGGGMTPGRHRGRRFDAVLAHYWETEAAVSAAVAVIRRMHPEAHVTVYAKGPPGGTMSNQGKMGASHAALAALADELIVMPNVGREGMTHLTHLVGRYWQLAEHTLFIQAAPAPDFEQRLALLTNATGVLNMGGMDATTCEGSSAFPFARLRELYALTQHTFCPYTRGASFQGMMNGMFAVSRRRVHTQPLALYRYLLSLMDAPPEHFTHGDHEDTYGPQGKNEPNKVHEFAELDGQADGLRNWNAANYFSYMMERGWAVLFSCMRAESARCCNGDVCKPGDCQCEDDAP